MVTKLQHGTPINKLSKNWHLEEGLEQLAHSLPHISVLIPSHVHWTANKVADRLANEGVSCDQQAWDTKWCPNRNLRLATDCLSLAKKDRHSLDGVLYGASICEDTRSHQGRTCELPGGGGKVQGVHANIDCPDHGTHAD